jgi:putative transposase
MPFRPDPFSTSSPPRLAWRAPSAPARGRDWLKYVAQPQTDVELVALRQCVNRGSPYGSERWQKKTTTALGLESTLRPRGRPKKQNNEA